MSEPNDTIEMQEASRESVPPEPSRLERLRSLMQTMRELLQEQDPDPYDRDDAHYELHDLAVEILGVAGRAEACLRLSWHEGCSCHGSSHEVVLDDTALPGLARQLVAHDHQDSAGLDEAYWRVPLSSDQRDALGSAVREHRGQCDITARLTAAYKSAQEKHEKSLHARNVIVSEINARRDEWKESVLAERMLLLQQRDQEVKRTEKERSEAKQALDQHIASVQARR